MCLLRFLLDTGTTLGPGSSGTELRLLIWLSSSDEDCVSSWSYDGRDSFVMVCETKLALVSDNAEVCAIRNLRHFAA